MLEKREVVQTFHTDTCTISVRADGIAQISFIDKYELDVPEILDIQNIFTGLGNGKPLYILVIPGPQGGITKEARDIPMFKSDTRAISVVTNMLHQRILGNLYFRVKKRDFSNYKLVKDLEAAEKWLLEEMAKGS